MVLTEEEYLKFRTKCKKDKVNTYLYYEKYKVIYTKECECGFWNEFEDYYFTKGKGKHNNIELRWKMDYKNKNARLKNVYYWG
jgi:hypothetical protein